MSAKGLSLQSNILKIAIFATGLSGIVAEYILATMATYFIGDSVFQWTMIVSVMLFSMGIGSRASQFVKSNLLDWFIITEFTLSIFVCYSALIIYTAVGFMEYRVVLIYAQAIITGFLIGMEIPLVARINESYEDLRENISNVMALDYIGSLVGGVLFAFICVPYIGLTYTPFIFGTVNFAVALLMIWLLRKLVVLKFRKQISFYLVFTALVVGVGFYFAKPITFYGEQKRYHDKIIFEQQSKYQKIVLTQWKNNYWLYLNGHQQLSTYDEWHYHEPLVHPVMKAALHPQDILILGGGDGFAAREIFKYPSVESITLVDLDKAVTDLGQKNEIFLSFNQGSLNDERVSIINQDGFTYMEGEEKYYDVIIIDLPDPRSVDINRLYTKEFYELCYKRLRPNGLLITQSGCPYYATKAFKCVTKTLKAAGFSVTPIHHQILSLGEWGWNIAAKNTDDATLKSRLRALKFEDIETQWINAEAMLMMTSFGKDFVPAFDVEVNTIAHPILYRYYLDGNWDVY